MAISFMTAVDFTKVPSLNFVVPVVASDPAIGTLTASDEGRIIFNNTSNEIKYCSDDGAGGYKWVTLGAAGTGGPPSGPATGDLTGSYPAPQIAAGVIVDADVSSSAAIATSKIAGLDAALTGKAPAATDLTAGTGLTGGGTIAANRTFNVGAGTGITVNADDVAVNRAVTDTWYTAAGAGAPPTGNAGGDLSGTYPNPQIAAGVIVDADVAAANKDGTTTTPSLRTLGFGASQAMQGSTPLQNITPPTAAVSLNSQKITNLADPTNSTDGANKNYVDLTAQGLSFKNSVRCATTVNQASLSGFLVIDGVTTALNDRVLLAGQTTLSQNGIYVANSGAWFRSQDMDASGELKDGTVVPVAEGTANADSLWICTGTSATPWVPPATNSTWTRFASVTDLVAGAGLTKTGTTLDVGQGTGITVAADTVAVDGTVERNTNKGAASGYAPLDAASDVPIANLPTGTTASTVALGNHNHDAAYPPVTRQVIAGNGLIGGGALSADVTVNFAGDTNLSVGADSVSVLSAPKWTTARSITLTGDVTGTAAAVDGTANISIATTVAGVSGVAKHWAGDVPANGIITHNLNTRDVTVEVYRNSTPWDTVLVDVQRTSTTQVTLVFATAPTASAFRAIVTGR